ncbi:MAG: NAD(P)H-hydrate epimerase [Phycisphaerales bacterium]|nr:NAD(P)H-hydrate epimerase [Phycisphaerales bacterium]
MSPSRSESDSQGSRDQPHEELYLFTVEAIRQLDRLAVEHYGLTGAVLMENAARSVAVEVMRLLPPPAAGRRVLICCGPGNNGGDGLALARHLHNEHVSAEILLAFDRAATKLSEEAAMNLRVCERMELPMTHAATSDAVDQFTASVAAPDLIVDALLGTGARSAPRPPLDRLIDWINDSPAPVLSIDVPSGLDAQSGCAAAACVQADVTVALVGVKSGFLELDAQSWIGEIVIGDIGCPRELCERLGQRLHAEPYEADEPHRPRRTSHRPRSR